MSTNVVDDLYITCCLWWSILTYGILWVAMFLSFECHYQICSDSGDEWSSRKKRSISALFRIHIHTRFDRKTNIFRTTYIDLEYYFFFSGKNKIICKVEQIVSSSLFFFTIENICNRERMHRITSIYFLWLY